MTHLWRERHIRAQSVVERVVFTLESPTIRSILERRVAEQGSGMVMASE